MMERFLGIHQRVLKSMAIENDELYRLFFKYFDFVTTRGRMTGQELLLQREPLVYTGQVDEFKQMSQIFFAQGRLLVYMTRKSCAGFRNFIMRKSWNCRKKKLWTL